MHTRLNSLRTNVCKSTSTDTYTDVVYAYTDAATYRHEYKTHHQALICTWERAPGDMPQPRKGVSLRSRGPCPRPCLAHTPVVLIHGREGVKDSFHWHERQAAAKSSSLARMCVRRLDAGGARLGGSTARMSLAIFQACSCCMIGLFGPHFAYQCDLHMPRPGLPSGPAALRQLLIFDRTDQSRFSGACGPWAGKQRPRLGWGSHAVARAASKLPSISTLGAHRMSSARGTSAVAEKRSPSRHARATPNPPCPPTLTTCQGRRCARTRPYSSTRRAPARRPAQRVGASW